MLNIKSKIIEAFTEELRAKYQFHFGLLEPEVGNILAWAGNLALENLSNTNALYHDLEHTIMVTLVGQEIIIGKHLLDGGIEPNDWLHFMLALLFHDIGYVRGICKDDNEDHFATGQDELPIRDFDRKKSDVQLMPYHVDRSKLFVRERFDYLENIDAKRIASYIEMTRFPVPKGDPFYEQTENIHGLVRAADFIGQLGDPNYQLKIPALFYEFYETGVSDELGYENPGQLQQKYAGFYWDVVRPFIEPALRCLRATQEGKEWIANLHSHVFDSEHLA